VGIQCYSLVYSGDFKLGIYACIDSDWTSNPEDQKLQTGYFLMIVGSAFSWTLRTQKTVALSSTKAEYMALSDCSHQCVWIHSILTELGYRFRPIHISEDNQGSIFISSNPVTESRNKYIDVCFHAIWDFVTQRKVKLFFIEENENPASMFTKNLSHVKFCKFRAQLSLIFHWMEKTLYHVQLSLTGIEPCTK